MSFLDQRFPDSISQGSQKTLRRRVDVVDLANGLRETNARWTHSLRTWQVGIGLRSADDLAAVIALWEAAGGPRYPFRLKDWSDYKSCLPSGVPAATDQVVATGDASTVTFQLAKAYGPANVYTRDIQLPRAGSVLVALDGVPLASGWTLEPLGGAITFDTAPGSGVEITAGFFFDCAVAFVTEEITEQYDYFRDDITGLGMAPDIQLREVVLSTPVVALS